MLGDVKRRVSAKVDPAGWLAAGATVAKNAALNPAGVAAATGRLAAGLSQIPSATMQVAVGAQDGAPAPGDARFRDPAWADNPAYFALLRSYLCARSFADDLVDAGSADAITTAKAQQFAQLLLDVAAPTNNPFTNPEVLGRAIATGGKSLARGASYFVEDVVRRGGRPLRTDENAFVLGENMAATEGKVVYRNDLIEIIQYAPQTESVYATPLLACPPWINKYYIMDIGPGRSFVEWAIRHQRTVFLISYRNPDASMQDVTFEDYLTDGVSAAMDVVGEITGAKTIDIVGLCLGGAMASIAAGHLAGAGDTRVGTITLANTLLDYSSPGALGLLTDPATLARADTLMSRRGFLDGADMALTFDLLRANDLIFRYWISRWMLGEAPPAFDLLAWNEDSTRMPAAMHSTYLRSLYGENQLAQNTFEVAGRTISLGDISGDVYLVGAVDDHIVPWTSSYAGALLFGGKVRFVLSNGGHIAGIVNPPGKKSWIETVGAPEDGAAPLPTDPEQWRGEASRETVSWWQDWATWSAARAGDLQSPPPMGSKRHPVLGAAPGTYVFG
ncbi:alpha/beta fold hydrolase [Rhodococcus sp. D2-41]|uniref:PHA/PHB synthase family protein n=1 Tax=Speluncibacter jeojiensis TaxID=2710754 RepID=UPI00240F5FB2|nr:alpha/beta fold hydrolase [Rhodococcus sp. D2-41]MDG3011184.1 alpha/beta fold hydrolase [Rhodococcus sp. D2-41]